MKIGRIECFNPLISLDTQIVILGTIPGQDSIQHSMYYANENNHFWDFIYRILDERHPFYELVPKLGYKEKHYKFLIDNKVGLWDVIHDCTRDGSNDSKIKDPVFNQISSIMHKDIKVLVCNGEKAFYYLKKSKQLLEIDVPVVILNSTSTLSPINTFKCLNQWTNEFKKWL